MNRPSKTTTMSSWKKIFPTIAIFFSGAVLTFSGVVKVVSATTNVGILSEADPILHLSYRQVFLGVGFLEAIVVVVFLSGTSQKLKLLLGAGLSTNFLLYRLGMLWLGHTHVCPCLGNAADWLHLSAGDFDILTKTALAGLLLVSYCGLAMLHESNQ
jgi:hypothetical protein